MWYYADATDFTFVLFYFDIQHGNVQYITVEQSYLLRVIY